MEEKEKDALQSGENQQPQEPEITETSAEETPIDTLEITEASSEPVVESDEHEEVDEYANDSKELPDYVHMPIGKLVTEAEKLLSDRAIQDIKEEMEAIHNAALKILDDERNEKLHTFVEEGGNEIDFHFDQPQRKAIQDVYRSYKKQRSAYYKQLEEQLALNLDVKKAIIEEIKQLPNIEGSVPTKYARFRELQDRWSNTGPVPRAESSELWNNYHHHIDNFYDFLRISNQLRELDFKKNLEAKTELCIEAEALAEKEADRDTFSGLQELHAKWKKIGPVDREHREPMWERFSTATKKIHDKRHEFFKTLKEDREQLLERKKQIVIELENFDTSKIKSHGAWQDGIKKIDALRNEFRKIGRINMPENDEIWEAFRSANQTFNRAKNAFYKTLKAEHHKNLERKRKLLEKAEALKDSDNWREASSELKRIQADWKKIGYVPKSESDKIWKAFRAACNHFFNRLTEHNKDRDKQFEVNYQKKLELFEAVKAWEPEGGKKDKQQLKEFINTWKDAGRVPRNKREIEGDFNNLLDAHFKKLKLDKAEASMIRFENKVNNLLGSENKRELDKEEDILRRKIDEAQKELNQLENNIQFFAHADENNPIVKEANRNIDRQKEQIELLKAKKKQLRQMRTSKPKKVVEEKPAEKESNNESDNAAT